MAGRTRVVQRCFAAVSTVEPTLVCIDYERCFARPAWQRTLALYAERPA